MAELADALDLGSSAIAWGFESLHPHYEQKVKSFIAKEQINLNLFELPL